jgi:hypothetical protein
MAAAAAADPVQLNPWRTGFERQLAHGGHGDGIGARVEMFKTLASRPTQGERQLRDHDTF